MDQGHGIRGAPFRNSSCDSAVRSIEIVGDISILHRFSYFHYINSQVFVCYCMELA